MLNTKLPLIAISVIAIGVCSFGIALWLGTNGGTAFVISIGVLFWIMTCLAAYQLGRIEAQGAVRAMEHTQDRMEKPLVGMAGVVSQMMIQTERIFDNMERRTERRAKRLQGDMQIVAAPVLQIEAEEEVQEIVEL